MTKLIGNVVDRNGGLQNYPELINTSFSSSDSSSRLYYARFTADGLAKHTTGTLMGTVIDPARRNSQHERFAWDRLRNAVKLSANINGVSVQSGPVAIAKPGSTPSLVPLNITVSNDGTGHNFPTGFPEGRVAWVKVVAWDTRALVF